MKKFISLALAFVTLFALASPSASAADDPRKDCTPETVTPAGINVKTGGNGVYVYTNDTDAEIVFDSDTYNFRYSNLLVFDKDGRACGVGNCLVRVSDPNEGIWQRGMSVPAGGFAVAMVGVSAANPFSVLYRLALDGGIIYNSITGVLVDLYASFDGVTLTAYIPKAAEPEEDPKRILMVGNSSTYFAAMPSRLKAISKAFGYRVQIDSCTVGSAYLSYFADENHEAGGMLRDALTKKDYDLIILQDASGASYYDTLKSVTALKPLIDGNGAQFMFYTNTSGTMERANARIADYDKLCDDFSVKASPTCLVFASFIEEHPEINLFYIDNSHNSAEGAYLVACTIFRSVFGVSPVGNTARGEIPDDKAELIESFVDAAVDSYEAERDIYDTSEATSEAVSEAVSEEASKNVSEPASVPAEKEKGSPLIPIIVSAAVITVGVLTAILIKRKRK